MELIENQGQDQEKDHNAGYDRTLTSRLNGRQVPSRQLSPPGWCGRFLLAVS
jgi:hypothetical protein